MIPVKFYTLQEKDVLTYSRKDIQVPYVTEPVARIGDNTFVPESELQTLCLPIHHIRQCSRPTEKLLYGDPTDRHIKDFYIAIEPALQEILQAPFIGEVQKLQMDNEALRSKLHKANGELTVKRADCKELSLKLERSIMVRKSSLLGKIIMLTRRVKGGLGWKN
jgi:hypothetical protein